jgi:hypothetical protein
MNADPRGSGSTTLGSNLENCRPGWRVGGAGWLRHGPIKLLGIARLLLVLENKCLSHEILSYSRETTV